MRKRIVRFVVVVLILLTLSLVSSPFKNADSPILHPVLGEQISDLSSPVELQTNLAGEAGYSVFQLADGSLVLNTADQNCTYLIKIDASNDLVWTKTFQIEQKSTVLSRLVPTSDGGYLLAGIVDNFYALVKTDSQGNIEWTKMFGSGAPVNYFMSIIQTKDGGFAIGGFGEKVEESEGWIWFAKTDSSGNMQWNETISGPNADCPSTIFQTSDGGYVISDVSYSFVPNQAFFSLIKMDANGEVIGRTSYGGEGYYFQPECNVAAATEDGGYLMAGYLWQKSAWIVKTDAQHNMQWNQTYGTYGSSITDVLETQDGFLLVDISNLTNAGLIMTDKLGNELWNVTLPQVTLPVGLEANFNSIINTKDGGYIMVGSKNHSVWLSRFDGDQQNRSTTFQLLSIANLMLAVAIVIIVALSIIAVRFKMRNKIQTVHGCLVICGNLGSNLHLS